MNSTDIELLELQESEADWAAFKRAEAEQEAQERRPHLSVVPSPDPQIDRVSVSRLKTGQLVVIQAGTKIDAQSGAWYAPTTGVLRVQTVSPAQTRKGYHVHLTDEQGQHVGWISRHYKAWVAICLEPSTNETANAVANSKLPSKLPGQIEATLPDGFSLDWRWELHRWQYFVRYGNLKVGDFYFQQNLSVWVCYFTGWQPVQLNSSQECIDHLCREFQIKQRQQQALGEELLERYMPHRPF